MNMIFNIGEREKQILDTINDVKKSNQSVPKYIIWE